MASAIQSEIIARVGGQQPGVTVSCEWRSPGGLVNNNAGPNALRIIASSGGQRSVRIRRGSEKDFAAPMMMGIDQGGIEVVRYSNFRPVPTGSFYQDPEKLINLFALTRDQITAIQIDTDPGIPLNFATLSPAPRDFWFVQSGGGGDSSLLKRTPQCSRHSGRCRYLVAVGKH